MVLFRRFLENQWILDLVNRSCITLPSFCRSVLLGLFVRVEKFSSVFLSLLVVLPCFYSEWIPALGRWTGLLSVPV